MTNPAERVETLRREVADFKQRVAALPPDAWEQPSACQGWTVADVVAHLVGQDFALRITRGLQGDISPTEGAPPVTDHDEDQFARNIFQRAFATRAQVGDQLLDILFQRLDESAEAFAGIDSEQPKQWDMPCYWPPGPEPVRVMLDMRISELSMHAWDVCSRFDPDYRLSDGSVRVLMDTVPRAVRRAFRPDPGLARPLRFRFLIDRPVVAAYDLVFSAEGAVLRQAQEERVGGRGQEEWVGDKNEGDSQRSDVTFRCDGETYVMVLYGRLTPDAALASGRLTWEGDEGLALGFGARFQGG